MPALGLLARRCLCTLYLVPMVRGWTIPRAQPLRRSPAAASRSLLVLSEAAATRYMLTPDVDEAGINDELGVRIAPSRGKGLGVFARRDFDEGAIVGDYTGESLTARDIAARYDRSAPWKIDDHLWALSREERGISTTGRYIYRIEDDLYIDAEDPAVSSWARFINHSREPNLMGKSLAKYEHATRAHPHHASTAAWRVHPPRAPSGSSAVATRRGLTAHWHGRGYTGEPRVWFVARRTIAPGDELTWDYGDDYWNPEDEVVDR